MVAFGRLKVLTINLDLQNDEVINGVAMANLEILYNGKRIQILAGDGKNTFAIEGYPLTILDKKTQIPWGNAKPESDGSYTGFIVYGMHELAIDGATLRDLAADAYAQILWCEKHDV